jgi:hypothetical protein
MIATRMRRLGTAPRATSAPDLAAVIAHRLRGEQADALRAWAQDLTRADRRWLAGRKRRDG